MVCVAGFLACAFAPSAQWVYGIELSRRMLREAQARAWGHHNTAFCQADAEALPFRHGACDLVASKLAFHYFSQPQVTLAEMAHVATHEARVELMIALVFFDVWLGLIIFFAEQLVKGVVGSELLIIGVQTLLKRFEISDLPFGMTILAFLVSIEESER
jgi:SAM-dependent methyltransferase